MDGSADKSIRSWSGFSRHAIQKGTWLQQESLVKTACISSPSHSRKASSSVSTDILGQNSPCFRPRGATLAGEPTLRTGKEVDHKLVVQEMPQEPVVLPVLRKATWTPGGRGKRSEQSTRTVLGPHVRPSCMHIWEGFVAGLTAKRSWLYRGWLTDLKREPVWLLDCVLAEPSLDLARAVEARVHERIYAHHAVLGHY